MGGHRIPARHDPPRRTSALRAAHRLLTRSTRSSSLSRPFGAPLPEPRRSARKSVGLGDGSCLDGATEERRWFTSTTVREGLRRWLAAEAASWTVRRIHARHPSANGDRKLVPSDAIHRPMQPARQEDRGRFPPGSLPRSGFGAGLGRGHARLVRGIRSAAVKDRSLRWPVFWWAVANVAIAVAARNVGVGVLTAACSSIGIVTAWDRRRRPEVYGE